MFFVISAPNYPRKDIKNTFFYFEKKSAQANENVMRKNIFIIKTFLITNSCIYFFLLSFFSSKFQKNLKIWKALGENIIYPWGKFNLPMG